MLSDEETRLIQKNIGENLKWIRNQVGWTQAQFAEELGISEASLSNYVNGRNEPAVHILLCVCRNRSVTEKCGDLTIDMIVNTRIRSFAGGSGSPVYMTPAGEGADDASDEAAGAYFCIYYDQSKTSYDRDVKSDRDLRCGVIAIYDHTELATGKKRNAVCGAFFKNEDRNLALELKNGLDAAFKESDERVREDMINEKFNSISAVSSPYRGTVTYTDRHMFIAIRGKEYGDNALIALYKPGKRSDSEYVGGLGAITSVSRGIHHMPVAQKIIISKYKIVSSDEMIKARLDAAGYNVSTGNEAEELCRFCSKLFSPGEGGFGLISENDRIAILKSRLDQLVKNYVVKNVCAVFSISKDEDDEVFKMIKNSIKERGN